MDKFAIIFQPQNLHLYWVGFLATMELLAVSLIAGGLLTLPLTLMRVSSNRWVSTPVWLFTYVVRGTPLLIQVYFIYYGIAQLEWVQALWDTTWPLTWFKEPFFCAVLAFTLNTSAYTIEMLAGAIKGNARGRNRGSPGGRLGKWNMMFRLVLPSALRRTLPGYSNEVVMMLHATSLASVVPALYDLTNAAYAIYKTYYLAFQPFIAVAVLYFILTFVLVYLFRLLERRFLAYLKPRSH
ncbi:MAG: ABC transporter permease subunit [Burkholderiaceae bacterium]